MAKAKGTGTEWGTYEKKDGTSAQERRVAKLLKKGKSQAEIARTLGISRQRVGQLKKSVEEKGLIE